MKQTAFTEQNYSVQKAFNSVTWSEAGQCNYGVIATPHGLVEVCSGNGRTWMEVIARGRRWRRDWEQVFSIRYLTTLAKRFAQRKSV